MRAVDAVDSRVPILLTGLSGAAVMGAAGDLSLVRETRGADIDWGGVYGEAIRLTGPWWIRIQDLEGATRTLSETLVHLEAYRTRVESRHEGSLFSCRQEIVALADAPGVGRRLTFTCRPGVATTLRLSTTFRPELAPVLIEGIKPFEYTVDRTPTGLRVRAFGSALEFASSGVTPTFWIDDRPWTGQRYEGPVGTITGEATVSIIAGAPTSVSYLIWGGVEQEVLAHPERTSQLMGSAAQWSDAAEAVRQSWTAKTPRFRLPAAPDLERGYLLARDALRSLYFAPAPGFVGLVAGYPWYAALWCRDLAWMLPAVLWMGDPDWVAASLRSVFSFQAQAPLPVLGGARGELPMQIGPGPVFLYGTSDTTLYYPDLLRRYVAHTGDPRLLKELRGPLLLAEAWGRAKLDPVTGLLRNGDEAVGLREAAEEHGRVHYGFDAYDTTIWDSTDRRPHAVDIQVLWMQALSSLGELGPMLGVEDGPRWTQEAEDLRSAIATRYWWDSEQYLYDSLGQDGTPVRKLRPNALQAVVHGVLPVDRAQRVVERAALDDLATGWGHRTLSNRAETYSPTSYHDGQVWPIASAWAVYAAFAAGLADRGATGLQRWARQLAEEGGTLNECYRGDRPEPFNSCFLLGFSIAPFLTAVFEGLWGLHPQTRGSTLSITPRFPTGWDQASLEGVSLFGGEVDLWWERPKLTVRWSGKEAIQVVTEQESRTIENGSSTTFLVETPPNTS